MRKHGPDPRGSQLAHRVPKRYPKWIRFNYAGTYYTHSSREATAYVVRSLPLFGRFFLPLTCALSVRSQLISFNGTISGRN